VTDRTATLDPAPYGALLRACRSARLWAPPDRSSALPDHALRGLLAAYIFVVARLLPCAVLMPDNVSHPTLPGRYVAKRRTKSWLLMQRATKAKAVAEFETAASAIAGAHRAPSHRERVFLLQAIRALDRGAYDLARLNIVFATAPGRRRDDNLPRDPIYETFDLTRLRHELRVVAAQPVRRHFSRNTGRLARLVKPFPAFQPIVMIAGSRTATPIASG
jgi:hypothetical protein